MRSPLSFFAFFPSVITMLIITVLILTPQPSYAFLGFLDDIWDTVTSTKEKVEDLAEMSKVMSDLKIIQQETSDDIKDLKNLYRDVNEGGSFVNFLGDEILDYETRVQLSAYESGSNLIEEYTGFDPYEAVSQTTIDIIRAITKTGEDAGKLGSKGQEMIKIHQATQSNILLAEGNSSLKKIEMTLEQMRKREEAGYEQAEEAFPKPVVVEGEEDEDVSYMRRLFNNFKKFGR